MLFQPEAHEPLADEPWSAERVRTAIASIVADTESAFDDGWPTHPRDVVEDDDASTRFRTVYLGGAGVVDALHRLAQRGFVELRRDYVPYLERSLEAQPDFPDEDAERSLWMGETGIRLVLQRLAPSPANLERLSQLIAANGRDRRCDLMWGSPGTILAGRELGLDVTASLEWLHGRRDTDGLWTQQLDGQGSRQLGPAHGFAGCVLALGDVAAVSETLRRFAVEEDGLVNWPPVAGMRLDATGDGQIRTQWCHGAPGIVGTLAHMLDEELAVAGGELTWRAGPLRKGASLCHGTAGTDTHSWRCSSARETNGGSRGRARSRCRQQLRWSSSGRTTGAAATRSGRATSAQPSTSPTASKAEGSHPSHKAIVRRGA
jgi:Lanthionine synthetase C-like protein